MSEHNSGGPAFPFEYHNKTATSQPGFFGTASLLPGFAQQFAGMTLRDYFAGQCLVGELSAQTEESGHYNPDGKALAERCYAFADAMIAARNTKEGRSNG